MEKRKGVLLTVLIFLIALFMAGDSYGSPMGTAFTYQGRLYDTNDPANGEYDFEFELYDDPNEGSQQGSTVSKGDVEVIDSDFTVELDFGSSVFTGDARWLQVAVRPGDSSNPSDYVSLSPRQEVMPTPYAIYASQTDHASSVQVPLVLSGSGRSILSVTNMDGSVGFESECFTDLYESGYGVIGKATNPEAGANYGGYFQADGRTEGGEGENTLTCGIYASATGTSLTQYGVYSVAEGNYGKGVYGLADGYFGKGVYGEASSNYGHAGYFKGRGYFSDNVGIGITSPQAKLHINGTPGVDGIMFPDNTLQTTAGVGSSSVPIGTVIDWWRPNSSFEVPDGYQICDGSVVNDEQSPFNGLTLPDLRGRFARGASSLDNIGIVSGSSSHTHTILGSTESTVVTMGPATQYEIASMGVGPAWYFARNNHEHIIEPHSHGAGSLTTSAENHLPPYVRLLKIMRIR